MILTIPGLQPGQNYSVQVRTKTDETTSEWSPSFDFATDGTGPLPAVPTAPVWEVSGDAFYGEWDRVETDVNGVTAVITRYEMELSVGSTVRIITIPQSNANRIGYTLSFADNVATFGSPEPSIGMRVRAVNAIGIASDWTSLISATNPAPPPVAGIDVEPLVDSINVSWPLSTADDVLRYELQWSDSAFGPWTTVYTGIQNAFIHNNTMWNADSFYRVAVIDKFNTSSTYVTSTAVRPDSAFGSDTTPPDNPTSITVTPGFDVTTQNAYIDVAWTSSVSTDVGSYVVRYSLDNSTWQYMTVDGDRTGARINGLVPGTSYYVSVRAKDTSGNVAIAWSNAGTYPVTTTNDTTAPSQPSAPTAAVGTDRIQVTVDGLKSGGGSMESDVVHYQVHASTSSGFSLTNSTQLGIIQNGPAVVGTFHIPASAGSGTTETWYVRVRAVDRAGNVSPASAEVSANVNLIQTANIGDAQITNAKINDLAANKITAGTGIINDLTVKAKLTLGDASTVGTIESYDYSNSSGATGFTMSKNGLIIKTGSIDAAALNIAAGENIVNPEYGSFEWSSYTNRLFSSGMIAGVNNGAAFNGTRYLATVWGAAGSNPYIYLGSSATNYNQQFIVGQKYIISAYLRVTGAVATQVQLKVKSSAGASVTVFTADPVTGSSSWQRFSGVYTATTSTGVLYFESPTLTASAGFDVDGIQIEQAYGSATVPTQWRPSGMTQIDGGIIRTGTIASTTEAVDASGAVLTGVPAWSINMEGNAQFGNANVRGQLIVGDGSEIDDGELLNKSVIKSANYLPGEQGWAVLGDGTAEFRQLASDSINGAVIQGDTITGDKISGESITGEHLSTQVLVSGIINVGELDLSGLDASNTTVGEITYMPDYTTETTSIPDLPEANIPMDSWATAQHQNYKDAIELATFYPTASDPETPLSMYPSGLPAMKFSTNVITAVPSNTASPRPYQAAFRKFPVLAGQYIRVRMGVALKAGAAANNYSIGVQCKLGSGTFWDEVFSTGRSSASDTTIEWYDFTWKSNVDDFIYLRVDARPGTTTWSLPETGGTQAYFVAPHFEIVSPSVVAPVQSTDTAPVLVANVANPSTVTSWGYGYTNPAVVTSTSIVGVNAYNTSGTTYGHTLEPLAGQPADTASGWRFTINTNAAFTSGSPFHYVFVRIPAPDPEWQMMDMVWASEFSSGLSGLSGNASAVHWYDASGNLLLTQSVNNNIDGGIGGTSGTDGAFLKKLYADTTFDYSAVSYGVVSMSTRHSTSGATTVFIGHYGLRVQYVSKDNPNRGKMKNPHIEIDSQRGITLFDKLGVPSITLPTAPDEVAVYRGDAEINNLSISGSLYINSSDLQFGQDTDILLTSGTQSPKATLSIQQEYEQVTVTRPTYTASNSESSSHTFNPANVTSMAWNPNLGRFFLTEMYGNQPYIWLLGPDGTVSFYTYWSGSAAFALATVWIDPDKNTSWTSPYNIMYRYGSSLHIVHHAANGTRYRNFVPSTSIYADRSYYKNSTQPAVAWDTTTNPSDPRLTMFQNDGASKMHMVRFQLQNTTTNTDVGTHFTNSAPSGSGYGGSGGLAGAWSGNADFGANRWISANRSTSEVKVMTVTTSSNPVMQTTSRFPVATSPVAFTWDGTNFWQMDSAGVLTKYSNWTWTSTDNLYFGATYYDDNATGGTHETTVGPLASQFAKKRISKIRVSIPRVPGLGGADEPTKVKLYAAKRTSTPANSQLFYQQTLGSIEAATQAEIAAGTLATSGANPPTTNNFPSADSAEIFSQAEDGSGPLISIKGDGAWRLGHLSGNTSGVVSHSFSAQAHLRMNSTTSHGTSGSWLARGGWNNTWDNDPGGVPGYYTYSNGTVTFHQAGYVSMTASLTGNSSWGTTGRAGLRLQHGSYIVAQDLKPACNSVSLSISSEVFPVAAGDVLTLQIFQDSGATKTYEAMGHWAWKFSNTPFLA